MGTTDRRYAVYAQPFTLPDGTSIVIYYTFDAESSTIEDYLIKEPDDADL